MNDRLARFTLVVMLAGTYILGLAGSPTSTRGADEGGLSAAAVILSRSGTEIGHFMVAEPPGFEGVTCDSYSTPGTTYLTPGGQFVVYPRTGHAVLDRVRIRTHIYQRLPNGTTSPTPLVSSGYSSSVGVPIDSQHPMIDMESTLTINAPGSFLLRVLEIQWGDYNTQIQQYVPAGTVFVQYTSYRELQSPDVHFSCIPASLPVAQRNPASGTVNSSLTVSIQNYQANVQVPVAFDGVNVATIATNLQGVGSATFRVPAKPKGTYNVRMKSGPHDTFVTYTIKPRIKIIPNENIQRDQTVNVSLRGFAKQEVVRIRWKKGSSWVQIAQVTTSNTGSANINVKVPKFVPNGPTSVRGDGNKGAAAQTNAVTVNGGPFSSSAVKPTPTPTKTATTNPSPTAIPATSTPTATATQTVTTPAEATAIVATETPNMPPAASPMGETP